MADARQWLARARQLFDANDNGLAVAAARTSPSFADGAEWMRAALTVVRGRRPATRPPFGRLGVTKYAIASGAALLTAVLAWWVLPALLPLAIGVFYVVEVRMVFAFPLALDGSQTPLRDSHRLLAATASAGWATVQVMRIAAEMLFGGLCGRGLRRSWCTGCLAVLLWYETALQRAAVA